MFHIQFVRFDWIDLLLIVGITLLILAIAWWDMPRRCRRSKEIQQAEDTLAIIDVLRENEGASVTIVSDNGDPQTKQEQCAISVCDDWTFWNERAFYADTVLNALRAALQTKCEASDIGRRVKL